MSDPTHTTPRTPETKPARDHRQNDRFTGFGERLALRIVAEHFVHFRTATNAEGSVRVPETHRFRDIPFKEGFSDHFRRCRKMSVAVVLIAREIAPCGRRCRRTKELTEDSLDRTSCVGDTVPYLDTWRSACAGSAHGVALRIRGICGRQPCRRWSPPSWKKRRSRPPAFAWRSSVRPTNGPPFTPSVRPLCSSGPRAAAVCASIRLASSGVTFFCRRSWAGCIASI